MIIKLVSLQDTGKITKTDPPKKVYTSVDETGKKRKVYGDWMLGKEGQPVDIKEEYKPPKGVFAAYWVAWPPDGQEAPPTPASSGTTPPAPAVTPTPLPAPQPVSVALPENVKIVRQHSQEMAIYFLDIFRNHVNTEDIEKQLKLVDHITNYFESDVYSLSEKKELSVAVLKTLTKVEE